LLGSGAIPGGGRQARSWPQGRGVGGQHIDSLWQATTGSKAVTGVRRSRPAEDGRAAIFLAVVASILVLLVAGGLVVAHDHSERAATGSRSHSAGTGPSTSEQSSPSSSTTRVTNPPPRRPSSFGVGTTTVTLWRPPPASTENFVTGVTTPGRTLVTTIDYPSLVNSATGPVSGAAPAYRYGPFPLLVFAPGYDLDPESYDPLIEAWVEAGFVVVSPSFPDTNPTAVAAAAAAGDPYGTPEIDIVHEPHDVGFVLDQVAGDAGESGNLLHGLVDLSEVGLAGQSDGGTAVAALAYGANYAVSDLSVKIDAVAVLSGATMYDADYDTSDATAPPLLEVESATDTCNTPQAATALYNDIAAPAKYFLTLDQATHLAPYTGGTDSALVAGATTAFFELELLRKGSPALLQSTGTSAAVSSLVATTTAPSLAALPDNPDSCFVR